MACENHEEKLVLPHHEQQSLCTTRLPYRQGRKLTAVKVYTVNDESNHLLIFGVPSLKLRKEIKCEFSRFGKLLQFILTSDYPTEPFTETYHAVFEKIHSARLAKKMMDTKNFYGGSLHVCYAPELEQLSETRAKIVQRKRDVVNRLKNLQKEESIKKEVPEVVTTVMADNLLIQEQKKLNMGEINIIGVGKQIRDVVLKKNKRKNMQQNVVIEKRFKPCLKADSTPTSSSVNDNNTIVEINSNNKDIDVIDFTSTDKGILTNLNECLNYKNFGNELIKKVPQKPVNKIKFNIGNKSK